MRSGEVVHLRVMPRHVQLAIALCRRRGLVLSGMSLASVVSQGLKIALDSLVDARVLAEPDPFAYTTETAPIRHGAHAVKLANSLERAQIDAIAESLDRPMRFSLPSAPSLDIPGALGIAPVASTPLGMALEDVEAMTPLFDSWLQFFNECPYWPEREAAGLTRSELVEALPEHPWTRELREADSGSHNSVSHNSGPSGSHDSHDATNSGSRSHA